MALKRLVAHTDIPNGTSTPDGTCTTRAINSALGNATNQKRTASGSIDASEDAKLSQKIVNLERKATVAEELSLFELALLMELADSIEKFDEATNTFSELIDYPVSMSVSTIDNLAAILLSIPQMVSVSNDTNNALNDIGSSMSMPSQASMGISVGFTYLDAVINIISGVNIILDEENCHQTKNKTKAVGQIISGALALIISYNPALEAAIGLGAGALAGPAFAFMTLIDLINSSIDFYDASKKTSIEGWLDEQVDEINYIDKRIEKLVQEKKDLNSKHFTNDEKRQNLIEKIDKKTKELSLKRNTLINDFNLRSKIYCYGDQDKSLKELDISEYQRREAYLNTKLSCINKKSARLSDFRKTPTKINKNNYVHLNGNNKPSMDEILRNKEIQSRMIENYKEKRTNLILKSLSFIGATLFAIAPFAGPAAPILYASGLIITLSVAGYYIYKHREKIQEAGRTVLNKVKSVFFQEKKREFEMDTFPLDDPKKALVLA